VRLLSAAPRARLFARLAGMTGFRSFPVVAALLSLATARDARFRTRAAVGWAALTIVLMGLIAASLFGPTTGTARGLATQGIMQKIMVASILVVLWFESREAEIVIDSARRRRPRSSTRLLRALRAHFHLNPLP